VSDTRDMQRLLNEWLARSAPGGAPDEAVEHAITTTSQRRPRPAWLAMLRTPPMTTQRHPMVGSPTARLVYLATVLVLATAIATAGLVAGAQLVARAEEPAAANGLIAFDSEGDIWVAEPDGSNVRRLTDDPAVEREPVWSPDGTRLAFLVDGDPGRQDLVHTDTSGGDRVVAAGGLVVPAFFQQGWSPDGTQLTYSSLVEGGTSRVFVAQADGSGATQVGDPSMPAGDPAWSPDGRSIAFRGGSATTAPVEPNDPARRGLYVMDADGSNVRLVSPGADSSPDDVWMPLWSPDSSSIVAHAVDHPGDMTADIWVFLADGQGESRISDGDSDNYWATWSPDGRWVAWDHQVRGQGVRPAFAAPDGTDLDILDEPHLNGWEPVWSPDGTRVVVHLGPEQATSETWMRIPRGDGLGILDPKGKAEMVIIPASSAGNVSWQRLAP
jgi:dipeptidyl aminopeptidase/acylaminoacyl peptidase